MSSVNITLPQHPCLLSNCRKACHGCGWGCGHEYDTVEDHLDTEKMKKEGAVPQNKNYGVICIGCYQKYKRTGESQEGDDEKEAEDEDARKDESKEGHDKRKDDDDDGE